jgi:hypothetical protein
MEGNDPYFYNKLLASLISYIINYGKYLLLLRGDYKTGKRQVQACCLQESKNKNETGDGRGPSVF